MKLRYTHIRKYPPFSDTRIVFSSDSPLATEYALRFIVGVNGSGKSHLLQAISETFLSLADWVPPHFPINLVYELGEYSPNESSVASGNINIDGRATKTIILSTLRYETKNSEDQSRKGALWVSDGFQFPPNANSGDFDALIALLYANPHQLPNGFRALIAPGSSTRRGATVETRYLPQTMLVYTSGALAPWEKLWKRRANIDLDGVDIVSQAESYDISRERPIGWSVEQEFKRILQESSGEERDELIKQSKDQPDSALHLAQGGAWSPILIDSEKLKFVLLAVALPVGLKDVVTNGTTADDEFKDIRECLLKAGWRWPVSVAVHVDFQPDKWAQVGQKDVFHRLLPWFYVAGEVIAQPHPSTTRTLHFDLRGNFDAAALPDGINGELQRIPEYTQGHALLALLDGADNSNSYERFQRLLELHQSGLITGVNISLRKVGVDDILRFDELSDGEQMVLGRMALLHLLKGQHDSLLVLDEPETHFNDLWKRDVVSIVDDALADTSAEVLIATHAALMLTDALKDELVILQRVQPDATKLPSDTSIRLLDREIHTFGATGDHPLRDIFEAPDTVGRRASRLLEVLIAAASMAGEIDAVWARDEAPGLALATRVLALASETETGLTAQSVGNYLRSIETFAQYFGVERPLRMEAVLETFICQTGPGYFQVELKRAWRRLREGTDRVA